MKAILSLLKGLLPRFKPMILKAVQAEMDRRQEEDINLIHKVVAKYDHGLSGEQLDDMLIKLHDAFEQIIIHRLEKI